MYNKVLLHSVCTIQWTDSLSVQGIPTLSLSVTTVQGARYFTGTLPLLQVYFTGTLPLHQVYFTGNLPLLQVYFTGTLPLLQHPSLECIGTPWVCAQESR